MYCNLDSTTIIRPVFSMSGSDWTEIKERLLHLIYEAMEDSLMREKRIETSSVEYNSEKYQQLESVYSMADRNINCLINNYITANHVLDDISHLEKNWNGNGADVFSTELIAKSRKIVNQLEAEPFLCPTACGSIQFEYEKENGDYLEFEIYEDRIEVYKDTSDDGEEEYDLQGITSIDRMKQMVVDFFG